MRRLTVPRVIGMFEPPAVYFPLVEIERWIGDRLVCGYAGSPRRRLDYVELSFAEEDCLPGWEVFATGMVHVADHLVVQHGVLVRSHRRPISAFRQSSVSRWEELSAGPVRSLAEITAARRVESGALPPSQERSFSTEMEEEFHASSRPLGGDGGVDVEVAGVPLRGSYLIQDDGWAFWGRAGRADVDACGIGVPLQGLTFSWVKSLKNYRGAGWRVPPGHLPGPSGS